ncbi:MAG: ATP-binding protein [Nitrospiraceae bacterium]
MPETMDKLEDQYTAALLDSIRGMGESALHQAYELGRRALAEGLGVLDMAAMYHKALAAVLSRASTPEERTRMLRAGSSFFVESLSPFEMTHRAFRETNATLRRLNQTLEDESNRIAHALHDEAGQLLASVHLALEEVAGNLPPARQHLQKVKGLLDQIEGQLRRLSHELRPTILDDLGLIPALKFLAEGVAARTGLLITVEGESTPSLSPLLETSLYRIVQEAFTNVTRHAKASQVNVTVHQEPQTLRCSIRDNGVGFDVPAVLARTGRRGLGLIGIRERLNSLGGSLSIVSNFGQGTELVITIPHMNPPGA